ncbi:hypothetical protein EMIT0215P_10515 [Pseudomonas serboccidentalis]
MLGEQRFGQQGRVFADVRLAAVRGVAYRLNAQLADVRGVHRELSLDQVMQHPREVPAAGAGDDFTDLREKV